MDELFEEKLKIVLNLIRTNNSADEALKITQAVDNLTRAQSASMLLSSSEPPAPTKKTLTKKATSAA